MYYRVYAAGDQRPEEAGYSMSTILDDMIPIRRRRQIRYAIDELSTNYPSDRIRDLGPPFALTSINRKLLLEPKITLNHRIVVVGASETGLAFLETLVYKSHLRFNNLFLVSPHGLCTHVNHNAARDVFLSTSHNISAFNRKQIALDTWLV